MGHIKHKYNEKKTSQHHGEKDKSNRKKYNTAVFKSLHRKQKLRATGTPQNRG